MYILNRYFVSMSCDCSLLPVKQTLGIIQLPFTKYRSFSRHIFKYINRDNWLGKPENIEGDKKIQ